MAEGLRAAVEGLEQSWAVLNRIPNGPVEPRDLELEQRERPDSSGIAHTVVFAPSAVVASQLAIKAIPRAIRVGDACIVRLVISDDGILWSAKWWSAAAAFVRAHLRVAAYVARPYFALERFPVVSVSFKPSEKGREVMIVIDPPAWSTCDDTLVIEHAEIAGCPIGVDLPAHVPLCMAVGLSAPFSIALPEGGSSEDLSICVTELGTLYIAQGGVGRLSSSIRVVSSEGADVGDTISIPMRCHTFCIDVTEGAIYMGSRFASDTGDPVASLDASTGAVRWRSTALFHNCYCIAMMPRAKLVVASACDDDCLQMLRASDGVSVASARATRPHFVAADEANSLVFSATASTNVQVYRWTGAALKFVQDMEAPGHSGSRPLAVVPPAHGKTTAHLVVGSFNGKHLCVFSLPDLSLVFETDVEHRMYSLAADAAGTSLVVCLEDELDALVWPLPGMPLLR